MKWRKFTINTTTEAEDIISAMLDDLGVEGVLIEDNVPLSEEDTKGMFIDVLPELPPDDGTSRLSFFLRETDCDGSQDNAEERPAPGVNDTEENIVNTVNVIKSFRNMEYELLPYHALGEQKYAYLGREYGMGDVLADYDKVKALQRMADEMLGR